MSTTPESQSFMSLDSEERFSIAGSYWGPTQPELPSNPVRGSAEMEAYDRAMSECWKAGRSWAAPTSLLELPLPQCRQIDWDIDHDALMTREEAIEWCANENEGALEYCREHGCALGNHEWMVVVELGEPIEEAHIDTDLEPTGTGLLRYTIAYPMRIVQPTEAEMAAYPIPCHEATPDMNGVNQHQDSEAAGQLTA